MLFSNIHQIQQIIGMLIPFLLLYFTISSIFFTYKFFTTQNELKAFCKRKIWYGLFSIVGVIAVWGIMGFLGNMMGIGQGGSAPVMNVPSLSSGDAYNYNSVAVPNYNPQYQYNKENISDTRNFIKKTFSATLKTREVENVASRVEKLVDDKDGRIDSSNISKNYATISFVIPKSELSDFKDELKTYTYAKLYTQTTSSQNLLGEKKNLERNQDETKNTMSSFELEKKQVEASYAKNSSSLTGTITSKNAQLKNTSAALTKKESELSVATDTILISDLASQTKLLRQTKSSLTNEIQSLNAQLANLTNNYNADINVLTASIGQQVSNLASLGVQTENFLDKVETVEGYITIENVTYLQLFDIYSPISLGWILVTIVVLFMMSHVYLTFKNYKDISTASSTP